MQFFFAVTLFASAGLLFVVQPMFAKMVLPLLGGTPAVWNTCMVFYQAVLLAGYVYAHLGTRWLGARRQAVLHLVLMTLPWLVLPIAVAGPWTPPTDSNPVFWLLLLLSASVGLPFLVVSASAPMLQSWFSRTGHPSAKDPYFLYAASNLGSMLALLGYPFVMEPSLRLAEQTWWWAAGYGLLMAMTTGCAVLLWRSPRGGTADAVSGTSPDAIDAADGPAPTGRQRLRWVALALVPSSLLLGVTTHISTDLAAVPLLWIVPLALYLLSFVLVFARWQILPHRWMVFVQPLFVLPLAAVFFQAMTSWFWTLVALHLAAFFVTAMVCHGELARTRPHAAWLTEFYLWMSLGGVLGGLFNAILAPILLPWLGRALSPLITCNACYMILEYPLMIAVACMLRPRFTTPLDSPRARWALFGIPSLMVVVAGVFLAIVVKKGIAIDHAWEWTVWGRELSLTPQGVVVGLLVLVSIVFMGRPFWFGATVSVVLLVGYWFADPYENVIYATRSFFGVMRVSHLRQNNVHTLSHGSTTHGIQRWDNDPVKRDRPQSYYFPTGPLGDIVQDTPNAGRRREIGVIGLGTGSVSAYGVPGQRYTFFEIDPEVELLAKNPRLFTYLTDCKAKCEVKLGDARLSLKTMPDGFFDLLVVDAFSSDSIPIHLMTREAMALYLRKLKKDGVLAIHVSNRYLSLESLVGRLAEDAGAACRARYDSDISDEERADGKYASDWVAVAHRPEDLGTLMTDPAWNAIDIPENTPCWTDDFSNILAVIRPR